MGDARSVKLLQRANPKLMLGCTTTLMVFGHPGGQDMEDTVLLYMDARSVKLLQKANPKLMLGCTITLMVSGHLYGRKKREATPEGKSDADAWLYYNTYGVWPTWYAGYGGYGLGLYGRKKREATPEGKSDA